MASQFATLKGEAQSWSNVHVTLTPNGGQMVVEPSISDLSWANPREVGVQRDPSGRIVGTTIGRVTPECKLTFYENGLLAFFEQLTEVAIANGFVRAGIAQIALVTFDVLFEHTPLSQSGIHKVHVIGCSVMSDGSSLSEGVDPNKNEVSFNPSDIYRTLPSGNRMAVL